MQPLLHVLPVKTGDHVCVPAGTLHAIMGGLLIAEIQQNSNATYRVYDWNRVGADGKPRPLHVEKALDVIDFGQVEPAVGQPQLLADVNGVQPVSYTHLTLPTSDLVEISVVAVSLKKKNVYTEQEADQMR